MKKFFDELAKIIKEEYGYTLVKSKSTAKFSCDEILGYSLDDIKYLEEYEKANNEIVVDYKNNFMEVSWDTKSLKKLPCNLRNKNYVGLAA